MIDRWSTNIDGTFVIDDDAFWSCADSAAVRECDSIGNPSGTGVKSWLIVRNTCKGEREREGDGSVMSA